MGFFSLKTLGFVLLGISIAWIIGIFRVHQQYLKTLIKTISSRFFTQDEFNLYDPAAKELVEKKLSNGLELEVMYILKMLSSRRSEESNRLIIRALEHPSSKIVEESLRIIGELHIKEAEPQLLLLIDKSDSVHIRSTAAKIVSKIAYQDSIVIPLMDSEEKEIQRSAIISVLNHSHNEEHRRRAEKKIKELFISGRSEDKLDAATMLSETSHGNFDNELIGLLNEDDELIQLKAIRAIGHHPSDVCLEHLVRKTSQQKHIMEALVIAGQKALSFIKRRIFEKDCAAKQKEDLINVIGRIGGADGHELLLQLISVLPDLRSQIIKVLHRHRFKADKQHQPVIESLIHNYLVTAAGVLYMQKDIRPDNPDYSILIGSLQLELSNIRETLLYLFSFIYDREKISKIKIAIEINKKETRANAIELVDMTLKKEFANPFNAAFERATWNTVANC
jgi:HEAT repeat protein